MRGVRWRKMRSVDRMPRRGPTFLGARGIALPPLRAPRQGPVPREVDEGKRCQDGED